MQEIPQEKPLNVLTLVPVYNEWPHLLTVLQELRPHCAAVLVVDDGSDDKSFLPHLRERHFQYLSLPFNLGHWGAVQAGFGYALTKDFDGVITFDGDGQHAPDEIFKINDLLAQGYDLVIGEDNNRGGFLRKSCRRVLKGLSGVEVTDFTSGLRGYSRRAMERLVRPTFLNLEYQDLGVLFAAREMGLKMVEVPVRMRKRLSKKSRVFPDFISVLRYIFVTVIFVLVRRP